MLISCAWIIVCDLKLILCVKLNEKEPKIATEEKIRKIKEVASS